MHLFLLQNDKGDRKSNEQPESWRPLLSKGAESLVDKDSALSKAWADQMTPGETADMKRDQELAMGEKPKEMMKEVDRITNMLGKFNIPIFTP